MRDLYTIRQTDLTDTYEVVDVPNDTVLEVFTFVYDADDPSAESAFICTCAQVLREIATSAG